MSTPFVPDIGALVEYGRDGYDRGPGKYRVTGWMRVAPKHTFAANDRVADFLASIFTEWAEEDARNGVVQKPKMQWCLREEATHLSLYGICGATAPIEECTVTGMVSWSEEHLQNARDLAERLGKAHEILF